LVPKDIRPPAAEARPASRVSTALDERTLVPQGLPVVALDGRTEIPSYLPLDVLAARVVVPRDMPVKPLEARTAIPQHVPLSVLDSRVAVPKDLPPATFEPRGPVPLEQLPDVLEPDVITTGEVTLMVRPVEERVTNWRWVARSSSVAFHLALILFVLLAPKLFPYRPPSQAELDLARRQLAFVYLPPDVTDVPKAPRVPTGPTSPQMRIDPRVLRRVAPPTELQPLPGAPEHERVQRDLPNAPTPQLPSAPEAQPRSEVRREQAQLEPPKAAQAPGGLVLPRSSPGKALEESARDAMRGRGGSTGGFGGPAPGGHSGGGGTGYLGGNVEMLTPTEGVDFTNYLARVLASVKQNWYAVIPESARLGEKGRVVLQFRIMRDGNVPYAEPALVATSGKDPLDRAALSSIRASSPFEPLPPAFSGPFIELRFIFLYNLPLDYQ
ncbi:MAG TPA: energy transducer TonB, partial [Candidatus Acidoferrales bacterium]|nr:energy transducer TonB [Candidatus Acidoferrales bacterium]